MIIGLSGLKSAGKDTAGDYLVQHHAFIRASFAHPMKKSYAALYDVPVEILEEWKNDPTAQVVLMVRGEIVKTHSHRVGLQRYGTEAHREIPEFGDGVWRDMIYDKLDAHRVVVTDARFENECRALRDAGGTIVVIERDAVVEGDGHLSEAGPPDELVDFHISNNGSINDLHARLDVLVAGLANGTLSATGQRSMK